MFVENQVCWQTVQSNHLKVRQGMVRNQLIVHMSRPSVSPLLGSSGQRTVRTAVHLRAAKGVLFRACESSHRGLDRYPNHLSPTSGEGSYQLSITTKGVRRCGLTQRKAGRTRDG